MIDKCNKAETASSIEEERNEKIVKWLMHFHCGFKVEIVCPFKCKFHWGSNNLAPYRVKRIKTDSAGVIKPFIIWSAFQKQPHDHIYCIKLASCCCFLNCFGAQITGSNSNESKCVIRSQMSDRKKEKNKTANSCEAIRLHPLDGGWRVARLYAFYTSHHA